MAHNNSGHGVSDIYRSVINDVIAQVKEAFLDESIDIDVLNQLKKDWEEKINQSGCVDMDPKPQPPANSMRAVSASAGIQQPMVHRPQPQQIAHHQLQQHLQIQPTTQQILAQQQRINQQQQIAEQQQLAQQQAQAAAARQQQLLQQQLQAQVQQHQNQVQQQFQAAHSLPLQMAGMNNMQGAYMQQAAARVLPMQQYAGLVQGINAMPQNIMVLSGGQSISVPLSSLAPQQRMLVQQQMAAAQQQSQQDHVHQLDGGGELRDDVPCSSASLKQRKTKKKKAGKPSRKEAEKVARQLGILQLDGGRGGGMSDSSSDDEEEEEDPLRRLTDHIGDNGEAEDADAAHEDPLNSDDDQSDDEDLVTLFDAEDVVMCQFEKVSRARSKWKFSLKDGIMHINGKDFCFQKCTGEAEW